MANKLYKPLLIDSVLASADLPKQRFISFNGAVSGAGEKAYGICDVETESGQYAPVATIGILLVEAGGTITVGSEITSDANGKAVTLGDNQKSNGYALDDGAEGDVIRIIRGI